MLRLLFQNSFIVLLIIILHQRCYLLFIGSSSVQNVPIIFISIFTYKRMLANFYMFVLKNDFS